MATTNSLWLFIYFPRLALESSFRMLEDRQRPQLLLQTGTREVVQCNDLATQAGVRPGMTRNTAYCLLNDALIAQFDPIQEKEALERLAWLAYRFSAQVSLCSPDGLLLEIASMLKLFGGMRAYSQALTGELQRTGFHFHCATGLTAKQAETLARNEQYLMTDSPDLIQQTLNQLSTDQLLLTNKTRRRLNGMGIRSYQQLNALPLKELGYRFGQDCLHYLQSLQRDLKPPQTFELPNRFQESLELYHEASQASQLVFPLKRMLQNLEQYLLARQLKADHLVIRLSYRDRSPDRLTLQSVGGAQRAGDWLSLLSLRLEQFPLPAPVVALQLRARHFREQETPTGDLLDTVLPGQHQHQLLDLLSARLGHQQVLQISTHPDPRPQQATRLHSAQSKRTDQQASHSRRYPLFCLRKPYPVRIHDYQLLSTCERIVTGRWLTQQSYRKDFYRALHVNSGQLHWLSRRDDGNWFLEGLFS